MLLLILTAVVPAGQVYGADKPAKPVIKSLTSVSANSFKVKSRKNSKIDGYQIKYSLNKSFRNSKKVTVKGKTLNKTVKKLKGGKKYYVRIRTYKKGKTGKVFSKWSGWKSVKVVKGEKATTKYTSKLRTRLYEKPKSSSSSIIVWYSSKIKLLSSTSKSSAGTWYKVRFNGKIYYLWKAAGTTVFMKTNKIKSLNSYKAKCTTDLQKEVLTRAFYIMDNWNTAYDFDREFSDGRKHNGKYPFHCSGFASYVINEVMQEQAPPFYLSSDIDAMSSPDHYLNKGLTGELRSRTVCTGTLNTKSLKPGDLLFFKEMDNDPRPIDHVGIYIGNNQMIQSTRVSRGVYFNDGKDSDGGVCIAPLIDMYKTGFIKAVRILPDKVRRADRTATITTTSAVLADRNCEEDTGDRVYSGDTVKILYTYYTSSGAHDAYISYSSGKHGYLYNYEKKIRK